MIVRMSGSEILRLIGKAPTVHQCLLSYNHRNPLVRWLVWKRYEVIDELAALHKNMTVFEFGCGLGVFLPTVARSAGRVYATDLLPDGAIKLCHALELGVHFVEDARLLPAESLDVIVAADVLEHLEDLGDYLDTFVSKLKPDGRLIISGPTENLAYRIGRFAAGVFGQKPDPHLWDIYDLRTEILNHGFSARRVRKMPFAFPPHLFLVYEFHKSREPADSGRRSGG